MSSFRQKVQANTDWGAPDPAEIAPVRRKAARKTSPATQITSHRLFPVFAALWFAALFGLGSLAISSEALGALVTAIGLPALVPAAAPPLGFTAKLLVALILTVIGGGLGLLLGLRLRPKAAAVSRAVARTAEPAPSAPDAADGGIPKIRARDAHPDAPPRRPLVLTEAFADTATTVVEEAAVPLLRPKSEPDAAPDVPESWPPVYTEAHEADLPPLDLAEADDAYEAAFVDDPSGPNLPAELQPEFVPEPAPVLMPVLLAATPQVPSGVVLPQRSRDQILAGELWSPVAIAALDQLGLVQLIERLALAIAARKTASDAGPPPPSETTMPETAEDTSSDPLAPFAKPAAVAGGNDAPAGQAEPAAQAEPPVSAREAILRRLGGKADEAPTNVAPSDNQNDAVVALRPAFAAPDPVAAAASLDTDEALRAALATLQRMTARG